MAPLKNARVLFNEVPVGPIVPGKTTVYDDSQTIDLDNVPLNGGILVKILVLSLDPYMRGRMRAPGAASYIATFAVGQPLTNYGVARVLRSEMDAFKPGDYVYGFYNFQEYDVLNDTSLCRVIDKVENIPWTVRVGVLGMPGATAHHAWREFSHAKKGEVAFVTTAAGPVGATVVQLAKADGLKVIASVGSDDKADFVRTLGADVVFNYKTTDTRTILEKEGPIDVYWDNVGAEVLEAALDNASTGARFIECGMITQYNKFERPDGIRNLFLIIGKSISMNGFIVNRLAPKHQEDFLETFPKLVASGKLKYKEEITKGLANAGDALTDLFTGKNFGKAVIVVAED